MAYSKPEEERKVRTNKGLSPGLHPGLHPGLRPGLRP